MKILSIETSCDETGISILSSSENEQAISLLGNALASQIDLHAQYGGVFPAMAKRAHAQKIVPLMKSALEGAGLLIPQTSTSNEGGSLTPHSSAAANKLGSAARETILSICTREDEMVSYFVDLFNTYEKPDIDYIAVTVGPGLEPALWVGINAAKVLAAVWNIPVIPINHMEGHVVTAAVTEQSSSSQKEYLFQDLQFPLLALLVSGGHTELVLVNNYGDYKKIGQTRDDAVGEAFDKVARMLGLPYPGGPAVSKLAKEFRASNAPQPFEMPRPMLHSGDYDFSFSGIKTAMLYTIRDLVKDRPTPESGSTVLTTNEILSLACAFEDAVFDVIIKKTLRAAEEFHVQTIVVGGGVAGNTYLREQLVKQLGAQLPTITALFPEPWLATDNAVMIGLAAFARIMQDSSHSNSSGQVQTQDPLTLRANGNLSIETK